MTPMDTLLAQVKNKLSSAAQFIGGGALQGAQKAQQTFQPQISQATKFISQPQNQSPASFAVNQFQQAAKPVVQQMSQFRTPIVPKVDQFTKKVGSYLGPQGQQAIQNAFPITQLPAQAEELVRQGGRLLSLKPNVGDVASIALPMVAGKLQALQPAKANAAVQLLRNKLTKGDVDTIGRFAEIVETKGGKVQMDKELGNTIQSLAKNVFGKESETWSNQKLKNVFDLVLGKIGQGPNTAGLGLTAKSIRSVQEAQDAIKRVSVQPRGFTESVQQAGNIPKRVKGMVQNVYTQKPNTKLMGEAQALLQEGASLDITKVQNVDQKIAATIQEAINQQRKNPDLAANLYNNLARQGTELGRGVQAFSLLQKMSPEAIAKSAAGKIQEYNRTAVRKIPELTGDQLKMITSKVDAIKKLTVGSREHNIAVNELSNIVNQFIPSSIADKAITVWKAGLLTSLRTTERNLFGNTIHGAAEAIKDLPATMADMLMSMATGKRTVTPTFRGVSEAWSKKTAQQISDTIKLGYDATEDISKFDHKRITWGNTPLEKGLKVYTDAVFRSLGAQDKPFYNAAFKRSLFSQAGAEAINVGRGGDRSFIQSLVSKPTEDMLKIAMSDANVATFKDKNSASKAIGNVKRIMEEVKLGDIEVGKIFSEITMPFTGVPSSILGQIASYSPIGLIKGIADTGKVLATQVPDLQRQAAQEIGRGVIGTGVFALGSYLASKGMITGQPKDAEEQRQWDLENKPRNSIMIGGKWRSLNSIGPEAVVFLAGAKLNEEMNNPEGSLGVYAGKLGKDYLDQSFVQGLQAPVNAATDFQRYGKSYVGNLSSSFVPNIVKDTSKALDTSQRETNTIPDYVKSAIPGVRNTLIEKRDSLGNVMKQEPTGLGAFIDLFNSKTPIDNEVVSELGRLQREGEGATPSKLTPQQTILKQKVKLTFDQLNQLEQGVGELVRPRLETLISSPVYQQLDDEHKAKAIDSIVQDARLKYKNINAKTLTGAGLDPNQYLDVNGNLKSVSTQPIEPPKLTGNKTIDDKLKASYKTALETQQMDQYKLSNQSTPDIGKKTYDYIDENGNYKTIDLTPVSFPKLTGNDIVDKKLKSAYYSSINSQINDVIKLGQAGQITEKEMIDMVSTLNAQYTKGKGKKVAGLNPTFKTRKVPKLKALKVKKPKKIKVPKLAKIKPITYKKVKYKSTS